MLSREASRVRRLTVGPARGQRQLIAECFLFSSAFFISRSTWQAIFNSRNSGCMLLIPNGKPRTPWANAGIPNAGGTVRAAGAAPTKKQSRRPAKSARQAAISCQVAVVVPFSFHKQYRRSNGTSTRPSPLYSSPVKDLRLGISQIAKLAGKQTSTTYLVLLPKSSCSW